jgi:hypothetical protein
MVAIQESEGGHVGLARLESTDQMQLRRFFFRLSPETLYRRFHSPIARPEQAQPQRLLDLDHHMQSDNRPVLRLVRRLYPEATLRHEHGMSETTVPVAGT